MTLDSIPKGTHSHILKPKILNLKEIRMGMSEDYLKAIENSSTYLRIGSKIFGPRS